MTKLVSVSRHKNINSLRFTLLVPHHSSETKTYTVFGHKSFKKLVWMKPGSRQPTVRAGGAALFHSNVVKTMVSI